MSDIEKKQASHKEIRKSARSILSNAAIAFLAVIMFGPIASFVGQYIVVQLMVALHIV